MYSEYYIDYIYGTIQYSKNIYKYIYSFETAYKYFTQSTSIYPFQYNFTRIP